jgi:hypothetical protein
MSLPLVSAMNIARLPLCCPFAMKGETLCAEMEVLELSSLFFCCATIQAGFLILLVEEEEEEPVVGLDTGCVVVVDEGEEGGLGAEALATASAE